MICWLLAAAFYVSGALYANNLIGITAAVAYLIGINPPTLLILKFARNRNQYKYISLLINLLEIIGYTTIIYFAGGMESAYLGLLYAALITYVGVVAPRPLPFIIAILCSISFIIMAVLEYSGIIPSQSLMPGNVIPLANQVLMTSTLIGLLFVVAFISSYTAALLAKSKNKLQQNYDMLAQTHEQMRAEIDRSNRLQRELAQSESLFRTITENMLDFVAILDLNGVYRYVSPSHAIGTGYRTEDMEGKSGFDFVHPEDRNRIQLELARGLQDPGQKTLEMRFRRADGTYLWIESVGSPVFDQDGSVREIILSSRDISERKNVEQSLQRHAEEMERVNRLMRGRENRVLELKAAINDLLVRQGETPRYTATASNLGETKTGKEHGHGT